MEDRAEPVAVLGDVDGGEGRAEDRNTGLLQTAREPKRRLPAEHHHDADRPFAVDHLEHVLDRQRLEVQAVRRLGVGRDGLGVAVHHDGVVAQLSERAHGLDAAVVELDALADPVGPGAEDDDGRALGLRKLVLELVRRVEVRRLGLDLSRAGVDGFVHRPHARRPSQPADGRLVGARQRRDAGVRHAERLQPSPVGLDEARDRRPAEHALGVGDELPLVDEPGMHARLGGQGGRVVAGGETALDGVEAVPLGLGHRPVGPRLVVELARSHRLAPRLGERPADAHDLADRLHLRGQAGRGARELLEREAGQLDDHVVQGGLEGGRRRPGDVVRDLVERVADGEPGRDLRDRVARGLGRQRGRPRDARVHLDDDQLAGVAVQRELDVRAARLDADRPDDRRRRVAQGLVLAVAQRLRGRDSGRVAGVDPHGVDVLDRADDDHVVDPVADHLELELTPARDRLLEQDLRDGALAQAPLDSVLELLRRRGEAAAVAPERERRPDDDGQVQRAGGERGPRLLHPRRDDARRDAQADRGHRLGEELAVLRPADGVVRRADQLDAELFEDAVLMQLRREVERRLASERRQERVGPLTAEH